MYEEWLEEALTAQSTETTKILPEYVFGRLWQISAQYPNAGSSLAAPDLLIYDRHGVRFVDTYRKSKLPAVCFLSKAEAEEYAKKLKASNKNAILTIKQSPKEKVCARTPLADNIYVVADTPADVKSSLNKIAFIDIDGNIIENKDTPSIKLTHSFFNEQVLQPVREILKSEYKDKIDTAFSQILYKIASEESSEYIELSKPKLRSNEDAFFYLTENDLHVFYIYEGPAITTPPILPEELWYIDKNTYIHNQTIQCNLEDKSILYHVSSHIMEDQSIDIPFNKQVSLNYIEDTKKELLDRFKKGIEDEILNNDLNYLYSKIKKDTHEIIEAKSTFIENYTTCVEL